MKLHTNNFEVSALLFFVLCSVAHSQNPTETCGDIQNGLVCLDCTHYDVCTDGELGTSVPGGLPAACAEGQVCDNNVAHGLCFTPVSSDASSCFCKESGCFSDPNDSSAYMECTGTETVGDKAPQSPCDHATENFNIDTCECQPALCPTCGMMVADTSTCPTSYYYCADGSGAGPFNCGDGQCFLDTGSSCGCVDSSVLTTTQFPGGGSTTSSTFTCLSCGLGKVPEDCSGYYSCNPDGTITGSYECPGTLCFNEDLCNCY